MDEPHFQNLFHWSKWVPSQLALLLAVLHAHTSTCSVFVRYCSLKSKFKCTQKDALRLKVK